MACAACRQVRPRLRKVVPMPPRLQQADAKHVHGFRDIFDLVFTKVLEVEPQSGADALTHNVGHVYATWFSQCFKSRRDVDATAIDVITFDHYVTKVDADAEGDLLVRGKRRIAGAHGTLDLDRTFYRIDNANELDQRAVTHQFHNAPLVVGDDGINQLAPDGFESLERACFIYLHEAAIADDIGNENRSETAGQSHISFIPKSYHKDEKGATWTIRSDRLLLFFA